MNIKFFEMASRSSAAKDNLCLYRFQLENDSKVIDECPQCTALVNSYQTEYNMMFIF